MLPVVEEVAVEVAVKLVRGWGSFYSIIVVAEQSMIMDI